MLLIVCSGFDSEKINRKTFRLNLDEIELLLKQLTSFVKLAPR